VSGWLLVPLVVLALALAAWAFTLVQTRRIEARYPPTGIFVPVTGGRLHVIDTGLPPGGGDSTVVLIHGASGNSRDIMLALGDALKARHRVLAFDRPGHGWSDRPGGRADAAPVRQAALIAEALAALGIGKAIIVGHSWGGSVTAAMGVHAPQHVAALVLLAPATHPWPGGVTWYYTPTLTPVLGEIFLHTLVMPLGSLSLEPGIRGVFTPGTPPANYADRAGIPLLLRPATFRANAQDVYDLKPHVIEQSPLYSRIEAPTLIISDPDDTVVWTSIHSAGLARQIAGARLELVTGVGHMVHHNARDRIVPAVDALAADLQAALQR
jgi:pimeloyl-ACP methyl ester carboxylesterase